MKKASLNLSVEAIVIVVLAFVMLGLGLTFIRVNFTDIGDTSGQVQEDVKEQILDDLRTDNKPLSFPVQRLSLSPNEKQDLAFGVFNTGDGTLNYQVRLQKSEDGTTFEDVDDGLSLGDQGFFWDAAQQVLSPRESKVDNLVYKSPSKTGTYLYKIMIVRQITDSIGTVLLEEPYTSKSFFVEVI